MNRADFLNRLEDLLNDISVEEKKEAIQFYQDYFDDAGPEHEAEVIQELGSPEQVAALIKADIEDFSEENGEYTETGYKDERFEHREMPVKKGYRYQQAKWSERRAKAEESGEAGEYHYEGDASCQTSAEQKKPWTSPLLKVILLIAIIIAAAPALFGVGAGVIGAVFGVLCGLVGLSLGLVVGSVAILLSGVVVVIAGVVKLFSVMSVGVLAIGIGILMVVLGLVATAGTVKLCFMVYPAMFRGIIELIRKFFHKKEVVQS